MVNIKMEFIDKIKLKTEGETIISSFLERLKIENNPYPKNLFSAFRSDKNDEGILTQNLLKNVLLEEQKNRCCYCMRRLDSDNEKKSLEHLIPKEVKEQTIFNKYLNPETVLNETNVCLAKDCIDKDERNFPPFPHTVAYQNLTVSGEGKVANSGTSNHCNIKRGSGFIEPFVLYSNISNEVKYKSDGCILEKQKRNVGSVEIEL